MPRPNPSKRCHCGGTARSSRARANPLAADYCAHRSLDAPSRAPRKCCCWKRAPCARLLPVRLSLCCGVTVWASGQVHGHTATAARGDLCLLQGSETARGLRMEGGKSLSRGASGVGFEGAAALDHRPGLAARGYGCGPATQFNTSQHGRPGGAGDCCVAEFLRRMYAGESAWPGQVVRPVRDGARGNGGAGMVECLGDAAELRSAIERGWGRARV